MHLRGFSIAFKVGCSMLLNMVTLVANQISIGSTGASPNEIVGMGLGTSICILCCTALLSGINGGTMTLVSQKFGSGDFEGCGAILHRQLLISTVMQVPLLVLLFFGFEICLYLGVPEIEAYFAGLYCRAMIPQLIILCYTDLQKEFLNSVQLNNGPFKVQAISLPVHICFILLFVVKMNLGIEGAAHATTVSTAFTFIGLLIYRPFFVPADHPVHQMIFMPKLEHFKAIGLFPQIKFSITCAIPDILLFAVGEILVIIASL